MKKNKLDLRDIPKVVQSVATLSETVVASLFDAKKNDINGSFKRLFALSDMPKKYQDVALAALSEMEHSKDPIHTVAHPGRMAYDLIKFLKKDPKALSTVDLRALTLAIPLHDLSRVQQPPTLYGALYGLVTEKQFAAKVARSFMEAHGMNESEDGELFNAVLTAVDEHTLANTFDRKSPVSQWLYGLDCLDVLSRARIIEMDAYAKALAQSWFFKPIVMWYKNSFLAIAKEFKFYQSVIEKEAKKRQPGAIAQLDKLKKKFGIPGKLKF